MCIDVADNVGGWDAFYLLTWLSGGSPVSILEGLSAELVAHGDPRSVQSRFVREVERNANAIRGAECDPAAELPIDELIDKAAATGLERMAFLGLGQRDLEEAVRLLVEEAHTDLGGGSLVRMDCRFDPFRLYVATRRDGPRHVAVGLITAFPAHLGGVAPSPEQVGVRLERFRVIGSGPAVEGTVHPWLPFPVEVF